MHRRRVVITGLGAVSPLGLTATETFDRLCAGRSGIGYIKSFDATSFPCRIAGEAPQFKIQQYVPKKYRKATKLMSRDIELAVVAADNAVRDAGLVTKAIDPDNVNVNPQRMAVNLGAGLISCELEELASAATAAVTDGRFDMRKWGSDGIQAVTPLWLLKYLPNMLACHISIIHDIQGPSNTITCAEAGGHLAIGEACRVIERDAADVALAGAGESKVNPLVLLRQSLLSRATSKNEQPDTACRPFDAGATGSVFGEGAGVLVLEELQQARRRGAKIYAELAGFGHSTSLNVPYEHLEADGKGLQIAIQKALDDAGIEPEMVDLVVPDGMGIPQDDAAEAAAITQVLGNSAMVWPTKSMLSATGAAAAAIDTALAAMCIKSGTIPAAKNCEKKAEGCRLNINMQMQQTNIRYALCCSYTYGGQTAALVLKNTGGQIDD